VFQCLQEGHCNSSKVIVSYQGVQPLPRSRVVFHTINMEPMFHHLTPTPGSIPTKFYIPRLYLVHSQAYFEAKRRIDHVHEAECLLVSMHIFPFKESEGLQ
jgi:hypothetical protein